MDWPYSFVNLSDAEKQLRRQALDKYALYAQLSALLPLVVFLLYRIARWAAETASSQRGAYAAIPDSPALKSRRLSTLGGWSSRAQRLRWWLGDDAVIFGKALGQWDGKYLSHFTE